MNADTLLFSLFFKIILVAAFVEEKVEKECE